MNRRLVATVFTLLSVWLLSIPVSAQTISPELLMEVETTRKALEAKHRGFVARNLPMDASESHQFWPVYDAYIETKREADDLMWQIVLRYAEAFHQGGVSDALAEDLLQSGSRLLEIRLAQQQQFLPQFQQVLPAVKVARFYQIANKLDIQMRMEMSQKIPLVE